LSYSDDITRLLKYFRRRMEELENMALSLLGIQPPADLPASDPSLAVRRLVDGVIEPLISVQDQGEWLIIAISLPGASRDTVNVKLYSDHLEVEAGIQEESVRRALGGLHWSRFVRQYRGSYRLPVPVDPSTAETSVKGDIVLIKVRKALY
jgi:HSP20 family molecular chaperone IbpA